MFYKKNVLKSFAKSLGKYLMEYQARELQLHQKKIWHRRFPKNFVKSITATNSKNTCERLFLCKFFLIILMRVILIPMKKVQNTCPGASLKLLTIKLLTLRKLSTLLKGGSGRGVLW